MRRMLYLLTLLTIPVSTHAAPDPSRVRPEEKPLLVLDTGGHTAPIVKLLFTPDSTKLISVGQDSTVQLWTVDTSERLRVLRPPAPTLKTAALSADGQTLAVGGVPYTFALTATYPIFLINLADGRIDKVLAEPRPVAALAFSPDGKRLAVGTFAPEDKEPTTPGPTNSAR